MPFQSEKQRRFLHANHPEIAKRWERDYANGGISNHFRRKFFTGALADTQGPAGGQAMSPGTSTTGGSRNIGGGQGNQGNQNDGGGPKPHSGPTFAEIEAQKRAALEKKNLAAWEHSQTLKQNKKERIKKTKYLKGLLKNDPLYDTYVAKGLLDWDNIKGYESDPQLKTDESLKAKQKGWWGYTYPYKGGGENLYVSNLEEFGQEPKGPLHATRSGRWNETIAEKNKRIAETIGHEARHQVLGADNPAIIGDPYSGKVNEALYEQGFVDENTFDLPGKGTHELINTMGDFQAYNNPTIYDDIYGTIHGDMPRHLSSPVADQLYDASTQFTKDTKARHEGEKYANLDPVLVEGLKQQYPDVDVEWALRDMDAKEVISELADVYYAKGGVARKNYYHGGILDINESEEIISDDGNDIELTDYNAAFDDPNDLSTGVKTLFQAKDGGTPQLAKKSKDGKRPGYQGPHGDGGWSPGVSHSGSPTGGDTSRSRIQDERQEDFRQKEMAKTLAIGPGSDWEKYDTDLVDTKGKSVMTPTEKYLAKRNMIKEKYTGKSTQRLNALKSNYNKEKARLESKVNWAIVPKILGGLFGGPLTVGWGDIKTVKNIMDLDKLKKQHIVDLTDIKESLLVDVDINNPNEMVNLDDTAFPDVMKELTDLTKTKDEDDDTGGDGPTLPQVVPVHEEIEEYEDTYAMSPWDRIKANQAKRAMLVEKGIIQDSPIVGETVTDITMQANSGGLANLFRVKNQ